MQLWRVEESVPVILYSGWDSIIAEGGGGPVERLEIEIKIKTQKLERKQLFRGIWKELALCREIINGQTVSIT